MGMEQKQNYLNDWNEAISRRLSQEEDHATAIGMMVAAQLINDVRVGWSDETNGIRTAMFELSPNEILPELHDDGLMDLFVNYGSGRPFRARAVGGPGCRVDWRAPNGWFWVIITDEIGYPGALGALAYLVDRLPGDVSATISLIRREEPIRIAIDRQGEEMIGTLEATGKEDEVVTMAASQRVNDILEELIVDEQLDVELQ